MPAMLGALLVLASLFTGPDAPRLERVLVASNRLSECINNIVDAAAPNVTDPVDLSKTAQKHCEALYVTFLVANGLPAQHAIEIARDQNDGRGLLEQVLARRAAQRAQIADSQAPGSRAESGPPTEYRGKLYEGVIQDNPAFQKNGLDILAKADVGSPGTELEFAL